MLLLTDDSVISVVDNARFERFERFASRVESLVRSYLLDRGSDSVRLSKRKRRKGDPLELGRLETNVMIW